MNVNDFVAPDAPPTWPEQLAAMYARQRELMTTYKEIEKLPDPPLAVHHAGAQVILKDFAFRTIVEMSEAYEALQKHGDDPTTASAHCAEELADAMHFLLELMHFAAITPAQCLREFPQTPEGIVHNSALEVAYWAATYELSRAADFLKNKPWKQSQVPTDEGRFRTQVIKAYGAFISLWGSHEWTGLDLFNFYFRKAEVNAFRQRSRY